MLQMRTASETANVSGKDNFSLLISTRTVIAQFTSSALTHMLTLSNNLFICIISTGKVPRYLKRIRYTPNLKLRQASAKC